MIELLLAVALAAGALWFVLKPILRPAPARLDGGESSADDEGEDPDDDLTPRAVALRALKEIEFDRATDKLAEADYDALKAKYAAEALAALRAEARETGPAPSITSPVSRVPLAACPEHGPRRERG